MNKTLVNPNRCSLRGRRVIIKRCYATKHGNNTGCVCSLIGQTVKITRKKEQIFVGTPSYHFVGSDKSLRRSEVELHPDELSIAPKKKKPPLPRKPITDVFGALTDPRLQHIEYIVFATHDEAFALWERWHHMLDWKSDGSGFSVGYKKFSEEEVCYATFWFNTIGGMKMLFVDPCGRYQDSVALEEFAFKACYKRPARHTHCDAANFHNNKAWWFLSQKEKTKRLKAGYLALAKENAMWAERN